MCAADKLHRVHSITVQTRSYNLQQEQARRCEKTAAGFSALEKKRLATDKLLNKGSFFFTQFLFGNLSFLSGRSIAETDNLISFKDWLGKTRTLLISTSNTNIYETVDFQLLYLKHTRSRIQR